MSEDNTLLQRVRQMDEQALAEVYDSYNQELFRYAWGLLGDAEQAEDCVAETFSRLLRALSKGGGPHEYLRAYLYRVAHNWINDQHRRQPLPNLPLDEELDANPATREGALTIADPAYADVDALKRQQLHSALARLTADQRQVITLKYIADLENGEIAQILDKPVGAIKSLQVRALAALRRMLPIEPDEKE